MDRCALFVDAGYVLGDGAMAVHGTRNRDSVSWDYAGVLQVLRNVARDRTGLPMLRCYWYEATVEGRRTAEHEALADLPGVKLRLGRMRPGRREGVESEIHRDLTTLARNRAISDALVVSAEEDLAQVVAEVQELGIRVVLAHIPVRGTWTASAALRQECDDVVEISEAQLRPSVELIVGAEPAGEDDRRAVGAYAARAPANGHGPAGVPSHHQALPVGSHGAPSAIYTGPVIAEYQRAAQPALSQPAPAANSSSLSSTVSPVAGHQGRDLAASSAGGLPGPGVPPGPPAAITAQPGTAQPGIPGQPGVAQGPAVQAGAPGQPGIPGRPAGPGQPAAQPSASVPVQAAPGLSQHGQPGPRVAGHHAAHAAAGQPDPALPPGHGHHHALPQHAAPQHAAPPPGPPGASDLTQPYQAPAGMPGQQGQLSPGVGPSGMTHQGLPAYQAPPPAGSPLPQGGPGQLTGPHEQRTAQQFGVPPAGGHPGAGPYGTQQGPPSGPQPTAQHAPVPQPVSAPVAVSLADAVQAAHGEGFNFGQAVARDAPALWLEAVLARKPRMPSDLEARLLQDSSLPIDSLLHDEVRHALRRGFWDALERVRH